MKVVLIACCGQKQATKCEAQVLYCSDLFRKSQEWAKAQNYPWFILSAKLGLLSPTELVEPYDLTLSQLTLDDRLSWAKQVVSNLKFRYGSAMPLIVLAGKRYRRDLVPLLEIEGYSVEIPMQGLAIGQQLSWLKKQLDAFEEAAHA